MAEVYFEFLAVPYLYDTKQSKLFQLEQYKVVEISDPRILKNVRFHSVEIGRERALSLAQNYMNQI
jgi:hypothetical protein